MNTPINWRHAPRDHEHDIEDVRGLDDALDGKVDGDDPRLSEVAGLAARLAALEYTSEPRDITAMFPEITSGSVITSRSGPMVTTTFYGVRIGGWPSGANFVHLAAFMPSGFRPQRGHLPMPIAEGGAPAGRVRIVGGSGQVTLYNGTTGMLFYATLTYPTSDPAPVVPPGSAV